MLASVLPGLRDVRTPLTVGYLWVAAAWLALLPVLPDGEPAEDGLVRRLFQISEVLGPGLSVTALSFAAYVLGAVATISIENTRSGRFLAAISPYFLTPSGRDAIQTYNGYLRERVLPQAAADLGETFDEVSSKRLALSEFASPTTELRTRLLIKNGDVFGEYDRLMSEAEFRLNVSIPLAAMSTYVAVAFDPGWLLALILVLALVMQGTSKLAQSVTVLQRAVTSKVIEHPGTEDLKKSRDAFIEFADKELASSKAARPGLRSVRQFKLWSLGFSTAIGGSAAIGVVFANRGEDLASGSLDRFTLIASVTVALVSFTAIGLQSLRGRREERREHVFLVEKDGTIRLKRVPEEESDPD